MTEIVVLPKPPVRPLFAALLPAAFALGCLLGALWPGHGGQLFGIGAFVGVWAPFVLHGVGDASGACWLCCLAGAPVLWVFGRMLDRLRIELSVWVVAFAVVAAAAGYALLQWDGDLAITLARHGSLWAVVVCAGQLGLYGATLLALAFGAGREVSA